jgi:hypothetical protein
MDRPYIKIFSEYFNGNLEEVCKKERTKSEICDCQDHFKHGEILSCDMGCKKTDTWIMYRVMTCLTYLEVLASNLNLFGTKKIFESF